jgi:predicted DNA-binding transcriptional regulator YafY
LPRVIATKADPARRPDESAAAGVHRPCARATLHQRQAKLTYHSKSSERTRPTSCTLPARLRAGGDVLLAYVPEYQSVRTFAVERIQDLSLLEERFTPIEELPDTAFPHSLGVHSGAPERIEIAFEAAVADYVRAREWHASQQIREGSDGAILMTLESAAIVRCTAGFSASAHSRASSRRIAGARDRRAVGEATARYAT